MMRILLLVAYAALIAAKASAQTPVAALPYKIDEEGWITVNATVNGRGPYEFVIDTGATITLVFENLAGKYDFQPTGLEPIRILGITTQDRLDTYYLGDVRVGAATLENHIGVILPDWEPPRETPGGIIGLDFLERYAVHFDASDMIMTLYNHGELPADAIDGMAAIDLTPAVFPGVGGALFTVTGRMNRKQITFLVDLGSPSTLINYAAAETLVDGFNIRLSYSGDRTGSRIHDVFDDRTQARTARIMRTQIGEAVWRNLPIWIYNAPLFDEIGVQTEPFGFAGADLVIDRDFALDFGENALYVARRAARR